MGIYSSSHSCIHLFDFVDDVYHTLKDKYKNLIKPELNIMNNNTVNSEIEKKDNDDKDKESVSEGVLEMRKLGRIIRIPGDKRLEDYTVIYIGEESTSLTNWIINLNKCRFCRSVSYSIIT